MTVGHHISSNLKSLRTLSLTLFKLKFKSFSPKEGISHCLHFIPLVLKAEDLLDLASASERLLMTWCFPLWFSSITAAISSEHSASQLTSPLYPASDRKPFQGLVSRSHPNSVGGAGAELGCRSSFCPRWAELMNVWCLSTGCIWLSLFISFNITSFLDKMIHSCQQVTFKVNTCSHAYWPFPTRKTQCFPELCPPRSKTQLCGSAPILAWSAPSVLQSADS